MSAPRLKKPARPVVDGRPHVCAACAHLYGKIYRRNYCYFCRLDDMKRQVHGWCFSFAEKPDRDGGEA